MPRKPRQAPQKTNPVSPSKRKTAAKAKPKAAENAINGDVNNSAFSVGENNGTVMGGGSPDERIAALFGRILDNHISDFENHYTNKKG
jgi:hypothetical protein